jgi:uncharacterized membrane protein
MELFIYLMMIMSSVQVNQNAKYKLDMFTSVPMKLWHLTEQKYDLNL